MASKILLRAARIARNRMAAREQEKWVRDIARWSAKMLNAIEAGETLGVDVASDVTAGAEELLQRRPRGAS